MKIKIVETLAEKRRWLEVPKRLFRAEKNWRCPLDADVEAVFDPSKNPFFEHGDAVRFLVFSDEKGEPTGRVAAFLNEKTAWNFEQPTGGMGFFDCENDRAAAFALFDACRDWLADRGMAAMDGPVNFGENYRFWGLRVEGDRPPVFGHFWAPDFYLELFKAYGFETFFRQIFYELDIRSLDFLRRIEPLEQRLLATGKFEARHLDWAQTDFFADAFCHVFEKAWAAHSNPMGVKKARFLALLAKLRPILPADHFWFAFFEGEPIGLFFMLPDLNETLKNFPAGRLSLFQKLRFLWLKRRCRRVFGFVFGVVPAFQNRGVESLLMCASARTIVPQKKYDALEMAWVGDFNPRMMRAMEAVGGQKIKTYATMRCHFSGEKKGQRAPLIGAGAEKLVEKTAAF